MLFFAGFMALETEEVLQLAALVLFSPRKVITAAEQFVATKSARQMIKCRGGGTIQKDSKKVRNFVHELALKQASR